MPFSRMVMLPLLLSSSNLHPLLKSGKTDVSSISSYRMIAIIPAFIKVFDYIILDKFSNCFNTNDCQFGYKRNHSTAQAAFIVKETVNYYFSKGSNVYACFLDASKAFDRVDHIKLFLNLYERNIPVIV
jgi:hypothetical protein